MFKRITALTATLVATFALTSAAGSGMTPTAATVADDCHRVAKADRKLCATVKAQHAYGWTTAAGDPQTWVPNGRALVREITHQGLTKGEMHAYLTGEASSYREHVTAITFNLDKIVKQCGHHRGYGAVQTVTGNDGHEYTWKIIMCD